MFNVELNLNLPNPISWFSNRHTTNDKEIACRNLYKEVQRDRDSVAQFQSGLKKEPVAKGDENNFFVPDVYIDSSQERYKSELERIRGTEEFDAVDKFLRKFKELPSALETATYSHPQAPHKGRRSFQHQP